MADYRIDVSGVLEEQIKPYIIEQIREKYKGALQTYLLYCATWGPSNENSNNWIPYSPILKRYHDSISMEDGYWPIESINLEYDSHTSISYISYKGDYAEKKYEYNPEGNLLSNCKEKFKGRIITRG
jgi:hypothetical protein